jgi:hypothetical protein
MHKVRVGSEGFSRMLQVVKKDVCTQKDQTRFLMSFQEETSQVISLSNTGLQK